MMWGEFEPDLTGLEVLAQRMKFMTSGMLRQKF